MLDKTEDGIVYLSYDNLDWGCRMLATQLFRDKAEFDCILAVTGDGLFVGHILSRFLKIDEVWTVGVEKKGKERLFSFIPNPLFFSTKRVLIVDMTCETGETFKTISAFLEKGRPENIKTAVLYSSAFLQGRHVDYVFEFLTGKMSTFIFPWTKRE